MDNVLNIIMQIAVLVFAVVVHEVSHGYVSYLLGDPTAKEQGRLTFNPISHLDPFMSVILPAFLIFSGSPFVIGGAKPVPINPLFYKNYKRGLMLVSIAGPGSNFLLAAITIGLLAISVRIPFINIQNMPGLFLFIKYMIIINVILCVFNLIPIPPLDGSKIVMALLPDDMAMRYESISPFGIFIIIILLMMNILDLIFRPVFIFLQYIINLVT
ncbi:MAG: site-2 protease family protein [Candidatus Goldbacteria bacterium]|nr:site-2 protease family protein [Candidatus Goldiibacteriota bacterium]